MIRALLWGLLAAVLAILGLVGEGALAACSVSKEFEINVVVENDQILIPASVNGQKVELLFDTGFPANIMPSAAAGKLGLAMSAARPSEYMTDMDYGSHHGGLLSSEGSGKADIPDLQLGDKSMRGVTFQYFRSKDNFGGPDVIAALGSLVLRDYEIEIDLSRKLITLFHSEGCQGVALVYWTKAFTSVPLAKSNYGAEFPVKLNGRVMTAVLDSGSAHSTITERAADRVGMSRPANSPVIEAPAPVGTQATDLASLVRFSHGYGLAARSPDVLSSNINDLGGQTPITFWRTEFDNLFIGGEEISPIALRVVRTPTVGHEFGTRTARNLTDYDILLGVDFLKSHRVMISQSQHRLYFSYLNQGEFGEPQ